MTSTSSSYKGTRLNNKNFVPWLNDAIAHLSSHGLYEFITHPDGVRPLVHGATPTPQEALAARLAADAAGGEKTEVTVTDAAGNTSTTLGYEVSVPDPVTRRVITLVITPKTVSPADLRTWNKEARQAAGKIWDTLGPEIQAVDRVAFLMRSGDPFLLWAAAFREVNPGTASSRYDAIAAMLSLTWQEGWQLHEGHKAAMDAFHRCLDHKGPLLTAEDVLEEVALYAFLSIVPPELDTFSSSVFITVGEDALRLADLERVVKQEDHRQAQQGNPKQAEYRARLARVAAAAASARAAATVANARAATGLSYREALAAVQASMPQWKRCWLCSGDHTFDNCMFIGRAQKYAKSLREDKNDDRRPQQTARVTNDTESAAADGRFPETPNALSSSNRWWAASLSL
ncbi:hypothetical protein AURDEDRAFT_147621 [Auricularia subglabra TFB-10046 SS5]|uniref:Uncharacterized protein n=1 Tax=Auricularia subglabra (strain TFB-10046 / SS5) TaxID=717982 RepID=J0D3Y2_AURST|nr:hypothetical protein AURDEDRAFT_147621 [Auricularia subglabra TFB-10046 SS5]